MLLLFNIHIFLLMMKVEAGNLGNYRGESVVAPPSNGKRRQYNNQYKNITINSLSRLYTSHNLISVVYLIYVNYHCDGSVG